jgi:hypothetical protein
MARRPPARHWQERYPFVDEWVTAEFSFTLNRLKQPSDEEKGVLSAIARAASEVTPTPDDKVRAVGVSPGALQAGQVALTAGMLPPAIPTSVSGRD